MNIFYWSINVYSYSEVNESYSNAKMSDFEPEVGINTLMTTPEENKIETSEIVTPLAFGVVDGEGDRRRRKDGD